MNNLLGTSWLVEEATKSTGQTKPVNSAHLEVFLECGVDDARCYDDGEHGAIGELCDDGIGALGEGPVAVACLLQGLLLFRAGGGGA